MKHVVETGTDVASILIFDLRLFVHDPYVHDHFEAPSGQVYCAGLEYAFRSNDARLKKHPQMGARFTVAPGKYRLTMHRTEYPDELMEEELRQKVTPNAFRAHQSIGYFVTFAVLSIIGCIIAFFLFPITIWTAYVLPLPVIFIAAPLIVSRLPLYQDTHKIWRDLQRNYPSLVAKFRSASTGKSNRGEITF